MQQSEPREAAHDVWSGVKGFQLWRLPTAKTFEVSVLYKLGTANHSLSIEPCTARQRAKGTCAAAAVGAERERGPAQRPGLAHSREHLQAHDGGAHARRALCGGGSQIAHLARTDTGFVVLQCTCNTA